MKVVIHDLKAEEFEKLNIEADYIISALKPAVYCKGCFGCWLKTPGKCVMKDHLEKAGSKVLQASELLIISKLVYGGYAPEIKRVVDRCIPGVMPFFVHKNDEMHHMERYPNHMNMTVYFHHASIDEQDIARELIKANGLNYWAKYTSVKFFEEEVTL